MSAESHTQEFVDHYTVSEDLHRNQFITVAIGVLALGLGLFHIYFNTIGTLAENRMAAIHFGGFGALCALIYPAVKGASESSKKAVLYWDCFLAVLVIICSAYLILYEADLYERGVTFSPADWFFSLTSIFLALEFSRRTTGWFIPILISLTLLYVCWWGKYVEGIFSFPGLSVETLLFRSYFSSEGMFGNIAYISATYVFMFILFGSFLLRWGGATFLIDVARSAAKDQVGGPGLVAVLASGLMGSVSGSAVANTCSTGVITIPIMKRVGFGAKFAAAVEAAASTGGQLMPPVMGAGVFILSSYTQVPYVQIITVSVLPALLYFASVMFFVRIEARKLGLENVEDDSPGLIETIVTGWYFMVPLVLVIALLWNGYTPTYAAGFGILSIIVLSWLTPSKMGATEIFDSLVQGARNMVSTAVLLVAIGLLVNVVTTVGIGSTFSLMISEWAQGSLFLAIVYVAIASLVLGMGLPVTASYIVLGTLSAPLIYELLVQSSLVELLVSGQIPDALKGTLMMVAPSSMELLNAPMDIVSAEALLKDIPADFMPIVIEQSLDPALLSTMLLTAHLIIFWLSQDSNVTPPVCLTAYAAAAIADSPPMATGFTAWKVAKGLYIIPLLFAFTPLISGDWAESIKVFVASLFGLYALTAAMQGYLEGPLTKVMHVALWGIAFVLLWPHGEMLIQIIAGVILLLLIYRTNQNREALSRKG